MMTTGGVSTTGTTPRAETDPAGLVKVARPSPTDRSRLALAWYRLIQLTTLALFSAPGGGLRASGRGHIPESGAALLVSNHLSHLDVLVLGTLLPRPLNFVARSTLFFPPLGWIIRSLGAFPIQRDGMGAQGLKETLRRLRAGGIVTLFPEGTRSPDGELGPLKQGIAVLAARARVPIIPAAVVGTFEAWPRSRSFPRRHPIRVHYGRPIAPEEIAGRAPEEVSELIRARILDCQRRARRSLERGLRGAVAEFAVGQPGEMD
jgi:1-acyl-sn-glycerol-3-phosphate acyltransferase